MSGREMYGTNYTQLYNYYKNQAKYHYEQYAKYLYYLKYYQWQLHMQYKKTSSEMHKNVSTEMKINYDQQSSRFFSRSSCSSSTAAKRKKRCQKGNRKTEQGKNWKKIPKQNSLDYENAEFDAEEGELELDVGFQNFLKQSAQFRKERGRLISCSSFNILNFVGNGFSSVNLSHWTK